MNKLEELMAELCPNGVEYYTLNAVCNIYDGTHQTPKYTDSGIKFASVENISNPYATKKYISVSDYEKYKIKPRPNDLLMTRIGLIGVCTVLENDEPLAYYVSLALLRPNNNVLNSRYLKYAIESLHCRKELRKRTLVNAVPIKINMGDIGKITIPVPPIPVQEEIVRILDSFTELTAELTANLTAEITARKKQYEYYRDKLLTPQHSELLRISDIATTNIGLATSVTKFKSTSGVLLLHNSDIQQNAIVLKSVEYITEEFARRNASKILQKDDIITVHTGDVGTSAVIDEKYAGAIGFTTITTRIKDKSKITPQYLCHYLNSNLCKSSIASMTISDRSNLNQSSFEKLVVPVPPLETQNKIVQILDNFDSICSDLKIGIPAEIEARKKQYEFYRDKLLSF